MPRRRDSGGQAVLSQPSFKMLKIVENISNCQKNIRLKTHILRNFNDKNVISSTDNPLSVKDLQSDQICVTKCDGRKNAIFCSAYFLRANAATAFSASS